MEYFNKLKKLFSEKYPRKKYIENLVIILIGVVIVISVGGFFTSERSEEEMVTVIEDEIFDVAQFEKKLSTILSNIKGAGSVAVMVSYQSGIETIPLLDTKDNKTVTEENSQSGTRKTEQNQLETNIIFNQEKSGNRNPYISKKIMPKVEGVIVACEGGSDINVKADIIKAVQAVTGISSNKIQVFQKQAGKVTK